MMYNREGMGVLETAFFGKNNFPFGWGIQKLVRNASFAKGSTLTDGAKGASERRNLNI